MSITTRTLHTDLPREWHRQTLYDWGRRGLRTRFLRKLPGAIGRRRSTWDAAWNGQMERIDAPAGELIRLIGRMTCEWVAVARKRGVYWPVAYYLVPRRVADEARARLVEIEHDESVPF